MKQHLKGIPNFAVEQIAWTKRTVISSSGASCEGLSSHYTRKPECKQVRYSDGWVRLAHYTRRGQIVYLNCAEVSVTGGGVI